MALTRLPLRPWEDASVKTNSGPRGAPWSRLTADGPSDLGTDAKPKPQILAERLSRNTRSYRGLIAGVLPKGFKVSMRTHAVALILAILLTLPEAFSQLNMVNSYLDILSERQGWGKNATGGADGSIFHVTSLADSGPGTLRDGLNRDEPLWIVFDVSGEIVLSSPLVPKSNKTIDGRGQAINVRSKDHNVTGFKIHGVNNLILLSFTMDDKYPDWMMDSEAADGINIVDSADVWIHHMHFARWRDGAIDMRGGAKNISVTWSRFEKIFQALNWTGSRLSFGYNYCSNVSRRCIQMIKSKAHSYNNLIERWGKATIQRKF